VRSSAIQKKSLEPILSAKAEEEFPRAFAPPLQMRKHPAFAPDVEPYLKKLESHKEAEGAEAVRPVSS